MFKYSAQNFDDDKNSCLSSNLHDSFEDDSFESDYSFSATSQNLSYDADVSKHFDRVNRIVYINNSKLSKSKLTKIEENASSSNTKEDMLLTEQEEKEINNVKKFLNWKTQNNNITEKTSFHHNNLFDDDFPDLSSAISGKKKTNVVVEKKIVEKEPKEEEKENFVVAENKKEFQVKEKRKNYQQKFKNDEKERKAAPENDNKNQPHKNRKSQLCKMFFAKGKSCVHGSKCRFAHSEDELDLRQCGFGKKCKMIVFNKETNSYLNNEGLHCNFLHPNETKSNFVNRIV